MKFVNSGWFTFRYRHVLCQSPITNKISSQFCAVEIQFSALLTHECKDTGLKMWRKVQKKCEFKVKIICLRLSETNSTLIANFSS